MGFIVSDYAPVWFVSDPSNDVHSKYLISGKFTTDGLLMQRDLSGR